MSGSGSSSGLEGIEVARTRLSHVDGEAGVLVIAGLHVEDLEERGRFEDACALLWDGAWPDAARREEVRNALAAGRVEAFERLGRTGDALEQPDGMDALRACAAHLGPSGDDRRDLVRVTGALAVFAAAWARARQGLPPVAPDPARAHAEDFLRMVIGAEPSAAAARGLDAYLVTVIDHGLNASTFTARVVASTGSDLVSAVIAALGALKGPLHGGAPGPVLDMLDAVGEPSAAAAWLEKELAAKRRIMGMGHRIYRVRDPRAHVLERAVERLERSGMATTRLSLARAVERAAVGVLAARYPDRPLRTNVEFYTAVLLDAVGLPRQLFTPAFAASRAAGWGAHVLEHRETGRLIRPSSTYVGPVPERGLVPAA
ncbi:MAG TPA: citrate synthase [Myxococcales bacterium]|nr:citrate synthase [Myxococcales bacterium]